MRWARISTWLAAASSLLSRTAAIEVDVANSSSVENAASIAGAQMLTFYNGTKPGYAPGILTNPYYWWEAGAMFGILIHFWHLTGNDSLNNLTSEGLLFQVGAGNDFEPANQTKDLGNDDQSFWAYAALDAAEFGFPNPPAGQPSWLSLGQAVFNRQIARWDPTTCGGGLRWQIYSFNPGWNYKNTAANGGLFQIAARLARYTGNSTYADQANRLWDWMTGVNFIIDHNTSYAVIDGANTETNCTGSGDNVDGLQWTYNHGTVLMGVAYMYNYTNGSSLWRTRLEKMVNGSSVFFVHQDNNMTKGSEPTSGGQILSEVACEELTPETCKIDQPAFKSMLVRWLAVTTQIAPWTAPTIYPWLNATALAAGQQCVGAYGTTSINNPQIGGATGTWCGRRWYSDVFDGYSGLGEQLSAMSAFQNVLIANSTAPYTTVTGGNSSSDPNAGNAPTNPTIFSFVYTSNLSAGDTAGAWILTALGFIIIGGGAVWMVREEPIDGWAGSGMAAGWQAPSAGQATMYRKTFGYGAYRLAGLQAGGVYAGKNAATRRRFAPPKGPATGQGAGGWWFGSGRGVGEKWWDKSRVAHEEELAEKASPYGHFNRASLATSEAAASEASDTGSRKGLFARLKSGSSLGAGDGPAAPKAKGAGEWKKVGKGVFVRTRDMGSSDAGGGGGGDDGDNATPVAAPQRSRPQSHQQRRARDSVASTVRKGKTIHWPA